MTQKNINADNYKTLTQVLVIHNIQFFETKNNENVCFFRIPFLRG